MNATLYTGYASDRASVEAEILSFEKRRREIARRQADEAAQILGRISTSIPSAELSWAREAPARSERLFQMEFESKSVYCIELISRIAVRSGFSEAATKMGHPERVSFSSIRTLTDLKSVWSGVKDYADHQ